MQGSADPNVELMDAAAFVSHLVPADSVYAFLAAHRRRLFPDDMFADLFASRRGRPSQPAEVIASVLVLQSLEGLSDREATKALATDLRWKVACGLSITDAGFHPTTLTQWRKGLLHESVTSDLACSESGPGRMLLCRSHTRWSSATMS